MAVKIEVSVVICTHNGRSRLAPVLQHIAAQEEIDHDAFEVIVVDNASDDGTAEVAKSTWLQLGSAASFAVIREKQLGLSHARKAGVQASRGEVIVFVDDDNWIDSRYLRSASDVMLSDDKIGACGGLVVPVFEDNASPSWFSRYGESFATGRQAAGSGDVTDTRMYLWGAGLAVRRKAIFELWQLGFVGQLTDRKGSSLTSGGDSELCFALRLSGWRLWYSESMVLKHWMPRQRLAKSYLRRLHRSFGRSSIYLEEYVRADTAGTTERRGKYLRYCYQRILYNDVKTLLSCMPGLMRISGGPRSLDALLHAERLVGRILELLSARRNLDQFIEDIANAKWRIR